ncbi:MAG: NAD(P)H-binding protein [Planctomycetes bacterium]|nr:NAD(P)H-binding protein [Planctomycetota bacterium]
MKFAVTGGTGFVGGHLARRLVASGHEVVLLARGLDRRDEAIRRLPRSRFVAAGLGSEEELARAFEGCDGVAHCAGINRESGDSTFRRVHVEGTANVVAAARRAGAKRIVLISFLRARPGCGSPYHESKFEAEEIVRRSGLDFTVLKPGVIYGKGDHMLDHLSHGLHSFPVFPLVGFRSKPVRPLAVEDLARLATACLAEGRLGGRTLAVLGPEELTLREAVRRVARVIGRRALLVPAPVLLHRAFAAVFEATMKIPLVARAQVRILAEGIVEPLPPCEEPPADLLPRTPFSEPSIRAGLPEPGPFGLRDCRRPAWLGGRS